MTQATTLSAQSLAQELALQAEAGIVRDGTFGDDNLFGGGGNDTLTGGAGDDTYEIDASILATVGFSIISEWSGADTIRLTGIAFGDPLGIDGTGGADDLAGTDWADTLRGALGNDTLSGGPGADLLQGGDGRDLVRGGEGADTIEGGAGDDFYRAFIEDTILETAEGGDRPGPHRSKLHARRQSGGVAASGKRGDRRDRQCARQSADRQWRGEPAGWRPWQ